MQAEILLHLSYKKSLLVKKKRRFPYTTTYYLTTNFAKELKERKKTQKKNIEIYQ